jgi:hypothetical protein
MSAQNYKNHIRFYAPHHFIFYPISLILIGFGFYMGNQNPELKYIWWYLSALTTLVTWLSFMVRQHYALTIQNRLIRLEVSHRYFVLTGKDFSEVEEKLRDGQLFALRFASNEEFISLVDMTLNKGLVSSEIKKEIKNWKADNYRV